MVKRQVLEYSAKQRRASIGDPRSWSLRTICRLYVSSLCLVVLAIPLLAYDSSRESIAARLWSSISESTSAKELFRNLESNRVLLAFDAANARVAEHRIFSIVSHAAARYGVDPALVRAVVQVESTGNRNAVSVKGAGGLMQLMPATARGFGVEDVFDPVQNIYGGTRYLRHLLDAFDNDMRLALAAYNAGPEKVRMYNGVPPYRETQNYVDRVMSIYRG